MVQFLTDYLHCVHFCENISTLSKEEKQIQAYNIFALVTIWKDMKRIEKI